MTSPGTPIDAEAIRARVEADCLALMADHPEVEAVGILFLSKPLTGLLSGLIVGANGPRLRPEQTVRLFEVWTWLGMQLLANSRLDVSDLDGLLGRYARSLADAHAEARGAQPQRTATPPEEGTTQGGDPRQDDGRLGGPGPG
jgi:hypothetical protein